jgi:hypothetical protein
MNASHQAVIPGEDRRSEGRGSKRQDWCPWIPFPSRRSAGNDGQGPCSAGDGGEAPCSAGDDGSRWGDYAP